MKKYKGVLYGYKDELHGLVAFIFYAILFMAIVGGIALLFQMKVSVPNSPSNF